MPSLCIVEVVESQCLVVALFDPFGRDGISMLVDEHPKQKWIAKLRRAMKYVLSIGSQSCLEMDNKIISVYRL